MSLPQLVLVNQFGEESANSVVSSNANLATPVAAHTVLMNNTGSSAAPAATAIQSVANALPSKAGITAISALAGGADLPTTVAQLNAILAALKVVS